MKKTHEIYKQGHERWVYVKPRNKYTHTKNIGGKKTGPYKRTTNTTTNKKCFKIF